MAGTLESFFSSSQPSPVSLATSQEIRDRGSIFVANAYRAATPQQALAAVAHLRNVVHGQKPASHEIAAWRCMVLKDACTGLAGPEDFELLTGFQDDGENWAGSKVLKVMQTEGVLDAVVIVSRWYGGTMLGPARFSHIETCAQEACRKFKRKEELEECIATLSTLDDILASLRTELSVAEEAGSTSSSSVTHKSTKKPDYSAWTEQDVPKARRLVTARENAIKSVKGLLTKAREGK